MVPQTAREIIDGTARDFMARLDDVASEPRGDWPLVAPDQFLYLRLAEIYAWLLGLEPRFSDSGDRASARKQAGTLPRAPDQKFKAFLEASLACFDWPDASRSKGYRLQGAINSYPEYKDALSDTADLSAVITSGHAPRRGARFAHLFTNTLLEQVGVTFAP